MAIKQTAGRTVLGEFAPKFAELNDDVLFGEVWSRDDKLPSRDRSLITVIALMSQGLTGSSFENHLKMAKANGISKDEITEIITHAAFYAGWPKAWAAFRLAKNIWNEESEINNTKEAYQKTIFFPVGDPNNTTTQYFTGQSYLAPVSTAQVGIFNVTFEPGCRNNWHIHHADQGGGQILICVGGRGFFQEWDKDPVCMTAGDVVHIPADVKHWHGAAPDSWFSHLALEVPGKNNKTEWCELVSDEAYSKVK